MQKSIINRICLFVELSMALLFGILAITLLSYTAYGMNKKYQQEMMVMEQYPWDDVNACIDNVINPLAEQKRCPHCRKKSKDLLWIQFVSPSETWQDLCGRAGKMSICPDCHLQVELIADFFN